MQILKGTKRQIIIMQWKEQINRYAKRVNNVIKCFEIDNETEDLDMIIEDCEKLIEIAKNAKKAIEFMDKNKII